VEQEAGYWEVIEAAWLRVENCDDNFFAAKSSDQNYLITLILAALITK